ncbi:Rpr2-domain-containing protein [Penicillium hispanicum]|uniref:Rpr2-domain-containing protein n=1 Tax=Penicillium hispanicum TaxID=1080232 RepID=UPI002540D8A6|nr:Rpr2-domain-containing protein [Penicillium hispanicum]KAJ5595492.1 Rpr2-domain-containing protein [Penicillium hispanicum]
MAKAKAQKGLKNPKGHLKARMDYLQRAASYLQNVAIQNRDRTGSSHADGINHETLDQSMPEASMVRAHESKEISGSTPAGQQPIKGSLTNLTRICLSQMRGVSLKTQVRLPVPVKRSFCKRCDTLLSQGVNCVHEIRNASRGRKKPWADVLIIRCLICGTEKRFPQTDRRSRKLAERQAQLKQQEQSGDQQEQADAS